MDAPGRRGRVGHWLRHRAASAAAATARRLDGSSEPVRHPTYRELFEAHDGPLAHKCVHYFDAYDRHLGRHRGTRPVVLEIGVFHGGSMRLWQRYFGPGTVVVGIDLDPRCKASDEPPSLPVHIGDQSDPAFLAAVAAAHGPFDVVIDDGSHIPRHQVASLEALWPHVTDGGTYLVEDLCTSYWEEYEGGPGAETFLDLAKDMVDKVNAFNSRTDDLVPDHWTREVVGMAVHDSIVVLDKGHHEPLRTVMAGHPVREDEHADAARTAMEERSTSG